MENNMQVMVVEIDENSEVMQDLRRYPAYSSHSMHYGMYFIKDGKIIGKGIVNSHYDYMVSVRPDMKDATTAEAFKDDPVVKEVKEYATFKFHEITGDYCPTYRDEPFTRGEGLSVVDALEFDLGITSKLRYGNIEGFGAKRVKDNSNG